MIAIGAAALVAAALIAGSILFTRDSGGKAASSTPTGTSPTDTTPAAVSLVAGIPQNGTVLGNPAAKVRMLQFEDLQCPFCKAYTTTRYPPSSPSTSGPAGSSSTSAVIVRIGPDSAQGTADRGRRRVPGQALAGRRALLRQSRRGELGLGH